MPSAVTVEVYDVLGRRVMPAVLRDAPTGELRIPLDVSSLAPGTYNARIAAGVRVSSRRLTVSR